MKVHLSSQNTAKLRESLYIQRRLAIKAHFWVATIKRICDVVKKADEEHPEPYLSDLHMLALALEHLDSCLRLLQEADLVVNESQSLITLWATVSNLRDALEHEEEYLIEAGLRPDLKGELWSEYGLPGAITVWGTSGPDAVSALGKTYQIGSTIAAALSLEATLTKLADDLDSSVKTLFQFETLPSSKSTALSTTPSLTTEF